MVQIEIENPEQALTILGRLDPTGWTDSNPSNDECYKWISELQWKIQEAMQKKAENTWKHFSSWDLDGVYIEINEFGEIRVDAMIFKPYFDKDYNQWVVTFVTQQGHVNTIDPIHFVKVHFNKDLEL
jgi:hypothetical protein